MMKPKIILTTTIILILASTITNAGLVCGTDTTHVCNIMEDNTWEDTPIIPYIHQWFLPYWLPYDLPHWIPTIGNSWS